MADSGVNQEPVITVWKDGTWKVWGTMDAYYAQSDPEWLLTISVREITEAIAND